MCYKENMFVLIKLERDVNLIFDTKIFSNDAICFHTHPCYDSTPAAACNV